MGNKNLRKAAKAKNDEFYTLLEDIELELKHYKSHFYDKVVYCNCDDPHKSNFVKYFIDNFNELGIDRLYATHYTPDEGLFCKNDKKPNFMLEYDGVARYTNLTGNGDFRSSECISILKKSDIVVTNPPFSLFRDFVTQLIDYNKQFLIIGNQNAITYRIIFNLLKNNKAWLGVNTNKTLFFEIPKDYYLSKNGLIVDGGKYVKVPAVSWFTNLEHNKINENIALTKKYNKIDYPKYDNYDAINVDRVNDIPYDYKGYMGVPITFMNKYNRNQFKIYGIMNTGEENIGIRLPNTKHGRPVINGLEKYLRIIIKRNEEQGEIDRAS